MIASILSLVGALVGLLSKVGEWVHEQSLINAGKAEANASNLEAEADALKNADTTRERQRVANATGGVPIHDPFSRD